MLSPFLQQSRQSRVLLLYGCLGRGGGARRGSRFSAAVRTGARTARGDRSLGELVCTAGERWPDARLGALGGLCTSASGDGKTEKEARRFDNSDGRKLSKSQQLKQVFKEYGAVGVVFHTGISLTSLGMFYLAVSRSRDPPSSEGRQRSGKDPVDPNARIQPSPQTQSQRHHPFTGLHPYGLDIHQPGNTNCSP
ncbi:protein FAM210B, mitochondrial isoform X2 [Scyliorhinus torazame]|uniref:protein FAM210B, mitochondrial isoform X2 n=1 Tax=Scyliorhinus torazame TaxID=75743 RepID=UPI003B59138A